jgi:methyltransferase-like protein/SAM-dependent methyltransferase
MPSTLKIPELTEVPRPAAPAVSSYDAIPYSVSAFPQTHPDRLATIATLFGMHPAPPDRCRVLELGCARGGNIIPMGLAHRQSEFVGIDLSSRQIDEARAVVRELELTNVHFKDISITDLGSDFGMFDYILCHGVYSWVPPAVQEAILEICRRHLAPHGVAYISYNALPGWHARGAIREMMWYHTSRFTEPTDRLQAARGLLGFLLKSMPSHDGGYSALIRQELVVLAQTPDTYLLHEHLEEFNEPLYFHQFIERAGGRQLQYLGEAQVSMMMPSRFGAETETTLRQISPDLLHMEQYMDFLRNRMFRQTLLVHANIKLDYALSSEQAMALYIASRAKPPVDCDIASPVPQDFQGDGELKLTTQDPLMKAAMVVLAEKWPLPVSFDELLAAARHKLGEALPPTPDPARQRSELAIRLLNCYTLGLLELSLMPAGFVRQVSDYPRASPYARLRARQEAKVVNMRLEAIQLTPSLRKFINYVDGEHDRTSLVHIVRGWLDKQLAAEKADDPDESAAAFVHQALEGLARLALLVA